MHLTNYSINKLSSQYTANEDANACKGHKWTISKLWEYMEGKGVNTKHLWKSLQDLVVKTLISGESSISQLYKANVMSRYNCYELFGIDVLLDEKLKPWLLEVNQIYIFTIIFFYKSILNLRYFLSLGVKCLNIIFR